MKRLATMLVTLTVSVACLLSQHVQAQDGPSFTRHYRFLPRLSILNETGGIYPRDVDYRIRGVFDFTTSPGAGDSWPGRTAAFENVDAWAAHPILAYVLPLDGVLNLSGLKGRQLPVLAPFDVYHFTGETQDGSSVNLYASVLGPWLRLRGETTPPPGSADFFEYKIRALARRTPFADFNGDDLVDREDLMKLTSYLGQKPSLGDPHASGDANEDGIIDGADLLVWQRQFGQAPPDLQNFDAAIDAAVAAAATSSISAVPEPAGATAAMLGLLWLAARRRR